MSADWLSGKAAIVGIGHTAFGKRGEFADRGTFSLVLEAIQKACDDAGISPKEIDGWSSYSNDPNQGAMLSAMLGCDRLRFTAMGWGGGGGAMGGAFMYAAMAVATGQADYVCVLRGATMPGSARFGGMGKPGDGPPHGMMSPGNSFALAARRHMARFGTTIDHFGEIAINARRNAANNPNARFRDEITMDDHHNSQLICDPLRKMDFCMESDFGTAIIITSAERAKDSKTEAVSLLSMAMGGPPRWGDAWFGQAASDSSGMGSPVGGHMCDDDDYVSGGYRTLAIDLYNKAGLGPDDVDVALLYDHFTPMVIMALEDFQFCKKGEGGPFVAEGNIRREGKIPVNTHGGNLAEVYAHGMTHMMEGVRQIRGHSPNQLDNPEVALIAAGASMAPTGAILLGKM